MKVTQLKQIVLASILIGSSLTASNSFASTTVCGNAEGTLAYSRRLSDGGAPLDIQRLTYEGVTVQASNPLTESIDATFADVRILDKGESQNGEKVLVWSAKLSGSVPATDRTLQFTDWVICREQINRRCTMCP